MCSQKQYLFVHNLCLYVQDSLIAECTDQIYIQGDCSCFTILISVSLTKSVLVVFFFSLQCVSEISSSPVMSNNSCLTYVHAKTCLDLHVK